ncbi:serine/threonine protein kinase [Pyxidicoccus fallax]|uniref:Serine/threonine protein kinase n=1 Tax=Pyxidicoccus fallax TaxID=394095 RepID=A0A848LBM0_9BACT|nr:serine/threonine-protein kinase [Pyxidicoccus fallax]NMO14093.1 serine/threonine protein kinase [Pyxidicoccus fallax]NPC83881.1 serine/threonine protein kinase [Pyxidicoccus fallax]
MLSVHLNPARLPLGTRVGDWCVLERRGFGAYGAVYRAVSVEAASAPVALKLALHPQDERFAREVELLSRLHHPNVPRLVDHGVWQQSEDFFYPYLAMDWVEGVSLYAWASAHRPTSREVLQVLARLARALEATHAAGGVHRDVKGDNILVSPADGRVFLTDFGSGSFIGAATLTWHPFPPGTPAYRPPEAWRSMRLPAREPLVPYAPGPADDVFALGVTAYRLVTDEYPDGGDPAAPFENMERTGAPSARAVNARCCEELDALVSRMLSRIPEARGSARELAEAFEQAGRETGPEADVQLFASNAPRTETAKVSHPPMAHQSPGRSRSAWLTAGIMGGALAMGAGWMLSAHPRVEPVKDQASTIEDSKDGGTVAVGDTALFIPVSHVRAPSAWSTIAVDTPPRPLPGQIRPDATGRCPQWQVPINGGCWKKLAVDAKNCGEGDFVYKGACYTPAFRPARPPTSSPVQ